MKGFLENYELAEAKRQKFHLDQLAGSTWTFTNTTVSLSTTETYYDKVTVAQLKAAFPYLDASITTVDQAKDAITLHMTARQQVLQNSVNAVVASLTQ